MFLQKLQNWLRNFMMGRYGADQLNMALLILALILTLLSSITGWAIFSTIGTVLLIWSIFRMYSRNISARYQENMKFLPYWQKMTAQLNFMKQQWRDRKTYRYYKCPQCKQVLRVPKGRGKIRISCPKCKAELIRKT